MNQYGKKLQTRTIVLESSEFKRALHPTPHLCLKLMADVDIHQCEHSAHTNPQMTCSVMDDVVNLDLSWHSDTEYMEFKMNSYL